MSSDFTNLINKLHSEEKDMEIIRAKISFVIPKPKEGKKPVKSIDFMLQNVREAKKTRYNTYYCIHVKHDKDGKETKVDSFFHAPSLLQESLAEIKDLSKKKVLIRYYGKKQSESSQNQYKKFFVASE